MSDVGCRQGDEVTEEEAEAVAAYENYFLSERGELRVSKGQKFKPKRKIVLRDNKYQCVYYIECSGEGDNPKCHDRGSFFHKSRTWLLERIFSFLG